MLVVAKQRRKLGDTPSVLTVKVSSTLQEAVGAGSHSRLSQSAKLRSFAIPVLASSRSATRITALT